MNYPLIFDTALEIGYQLAMCGAETYRIEECIIRIMRAYGADAEVFAIPNSMTATITAPDGESLTRLRRIGFHGNDMDTLERYSNLSRRICQEIPDPATAAQWVEETRASRKAYRLPMFLFANMIAAAGFSFFFGGTLADGAVAVVCGFVVGLLSYFTEKLHINFFFATIATSFFMALTAYLFGSFGFNADIAIIGTLMKLVPGLLFTNAIRDIIFGDTNSGINRIVQVVLIACAIGLGTGFARSLVFSLFGAQETITPQSYHPVIQCIAAAIGCTGFCVLFNIHGRGMLLCILGGTLSWAVYLVSVYLLNDSLTGYFIATLFAASYAEVMARIRHFPAITYLLVSIFPLIPGAGIYYTTSCLADDNMVGFMEKGSETFSIAGIMAIGILMVSTIVRGSTVWKQMKNHK
jgi:uncharacterized membrane protein YjjP (DUF1212 family)